MEKHIKTVADWRELAAKTMPDLPDYALENRCDWDAEKAQAHFNAGDNKRLALMFENLWGALPNSASIRFGAFFPLCTLCSEAWVLHEGRS